MTLKQENENLRKVLREYVEEFVWRSWGRGYEDQGKWWDGALSDAEWLTRELGYPPNTGWLDVEKVKAAVPGIVDKLVARAAKGEGI